MIKKPLTDFNVLVVEDDLLNCQYLEIILKKIVKSVDIAHNGEIAINLVKEYDYDIILMDITMPGIDGVETRKIIHTLKPDIPVVGQSAHSPTILDYRAEFDGYLAKPFSKKDIIDELNKFAHNI